MCKPRKVSPTVKGVAWYECPYCFDTFESTVIAIRQRSSCGCLKDDHAPGLTTEQKAMCRWLTDQIKRERNRDIPPLLLKLVEPKYIDPEWDPDVKLGARERFIQDIGDRPEGHILGWKDPTGPICLDNFQWKRK